MFRIKAALFRQKICHINLKRSAGKIVGDNVPRDGDEVEGDDGPDADFSKLYFPMFDASVLENGDTD